METESNDWMRLVLGDKQKAADQMHMQVQLTLAVQKSIHAK